MLKMPCFDMSTRPCASQRMKEPIIGPLKSKIGEIRHLGSCRLNAKTRFSSLHIMGSCYALAIAPPQPKNQTTPWTRSACGLSATAELLVKILVGVLSVDLLKLKILWSARLPSGPPLTKSRPCCLLIGHHIQFVDWSQHC